MRYIAAVLVFTLIAVCATAETPDKRAERILREVPLIDGHNDLPWRMREKVSNQLARIDLRSDQSGGGDPLHTDVPRLRHGRLGAQFWSVYVPADLKGPEALQTTLEQIDVVRRLVAAYPDVLEIADSSEDVSRIHKEGKIASMIGVEGGHSMNGSLAVLRLFHALGARYMTLTHSDTTAWADSATDDPEHDGLTPFGLSVIAEMNRIGMLVDLSHVSTAAMHDVLDASLAPAIFSHSAARAVTDHVRNVPDEVLRRLKTTDGVVMVTFVPDFVSDAARDWGIERDAQEARAKLAHPGQKSRQQEAVARWEEQHPRPRASIADVAKHIDHIRAIAGIDHIGVGSDFDGISSTPAGLESVADFPKLFAELARRGYGDDDLRKIAGLNVLRVMRKAEAAAAGLQKERTP